MLNLCSTCAQLALNMCSTHYSINPSFWVPWPYHQVVEESFSLLFFLWLIAYEKQRVLIFPQDPYRNQRLLPFFLLWSLFVYMPKWIFATSAQCTHTLVVCSLNYFHASIIFGQEGGCGFIMLGLFSSFCLYMCLKSSWFS